MASGSTQTSSNGLAGRYQMPLFISSRGLVGGIRDNLHALSLTIAVLAVQLFYIREQ